MNKKNVMKDLEQVRNEVDKEIAGLASHGHISAGLSCEGYAGGYRDALSDIILAMNGTNPKRRQWWDKVMGEVR